MPDRSPVCWPEIIKKAAGQMEKKYKIKLTIDENIIFEINRMLEENISALGYQPNVAKVAGLLAFWIRKLKPVSLSADSPNYYLASNEELALLIALALTRLYKDESGVQKKNYRSARHIDRSGKGFTLSFTHSAQFDGNF